MYRQAENLRSIFIFLFLNIAFFFLEYQDPEKYAALFAFDRDAFLSGDIWRIVTYQFTQSGQGWLSFPRPLILFFTLLLLYIMGDAIEDLWGTLHFVGIFLVSTVVSAGVASMLDVGLLGSYFVNFTLLFIYASALPEQTFYLFGIVPIRIRWLAIIAVGMLVIGVFLGGAANMATLAGAAAGYLYFLVLRRADRIAILRDALAEAVEASGGTDAHAIRNAARYVAVKRALSMQSATEVDRLITQAEKDIVVGVNICAPADFKPDHTDGYCIRCDGFSECSVRLLKAHRPSTAEPPPHAHPAVD